MIVLKIKLVLNNSGHENGKEEVAIDCDDVVVTMVYVMVVTVKEEIAYDPHLFFQEDYIIEKSL